MLGGHTKVANEAVKKDHTGVPAGNCRYFKGNSRNFKGNFPWFSRVDSWREFKRNFPWFSPRGQLARIQGKLPLVFPCGQLARIQGKLPLVSPRGQLVRIQRKLPDFPAWTVGGNSREGFPAWTVGEPHNKLISGGGFAYGLFEARATTLPRDQLPVLSSLLSEHNSVAWKSTVWSRILNQKHGL